MSKVVIYGGGTVSHVRLHLALCAPAYGKTARLLYSLWQEAVQNRGRNAPQAVLRLTRMADNLSRIESTEDLANTLTEDLRDPEVRAVFFNAAVCDYKGTIGRGGGGRFRDRLHSRDGVQTMRLTPAEKLITRIKGNRPDIVLVGWKTTGGATQGQQVADARRQIAETRADFVFANDLSYDDRDRPSFRNLIVTADGTHVAGSDHRAALTHLVKRVLSKVSGTG